MKNISLTIFTILGTVGSLFSQTQVGPGGVGDASTLSIWLDANQLSLSDSDPVATWADMSGNSNDFTQGNSTFQPVYVTASDLNGLPGVYFDGTNDFINSSSISALNSVKSTTFSVTKLDAGSLTASGQVRYILEHHYSNFSPYTRYAYLRDNISSTRIVGSTRKSTGGYGYVSRNITTPLYDRVYSTSWTLEAANNTKLRVNGSSATVTGTNGAIVNHVTTNLGKQFNENTLFFKGLMSDVICFNTILNSAQHRIVENYLANKYNLNIGTESRYAYNSTYSHELAGIGRDDASNQHLTARGTAIVEITAASLDDLDYLLWAHNNASTGTSTLNAPSTYSATGGTAMDRVWRVDETGETGDLTLVFDLTGLAFGDDADYELLVDTDGDFSNATQIVGTVVSDVVTFSVTSGQLSAGNYFTIGNTQRNIISVADGQDWNDASTWNCGCIPGSASNVTIDNGHSVTLTDDRSVTDLAINTTGALILDATVSLTILGDVSVDGSLSADISSNFDFTGSSAQTINVSSSVNFGNVEVDNAAGLTFASGIYEFSGVLTPTDGAIDMGDLDVTFVSSASGTAVIGIIGVGGSITGMANVKVQRFIPGGVAGFRDLGMPLNAMKLSEWDDELFISGSGFPDGCAYTNPGCYHSASYWRSDLQSYRTVNNLDSNIINGDALEIFIGDDLTSFSGAVLTAAGEPNTSLSVDIPVQNGWNLVGNPFLSPLDFDNITRNGTTGNYFYAYDPADGGGFKYWDGNNQVASDVLLNDGILSAFQGFWVFHTGAASTITINQGSKSPSANDNFMRSSEELNNSLMSFTLNDSENTTKAIGFLNLDTDETVTNLNVPKFDISTRSKSAIYTSDLNNNELVVNNLIEHNSCFEVPILVDVEGSGTYHITFDNLMEGYEVFAKNNVTHQNIKLTNEMGISFQVDKEDNERLNPITLMFKKDFECAETQISDYDIFTFGTELKVFYNATSSDNVFINVSSAIGKVVLNNVPMNTSTKSKVIDVTGLSGIYLVSIVNEEGHLVEVKKVYINN